MAGEGNAAPRCCRVGRCAPPRPPDGTPFAQTPFERPRHAIRPATDAGPAILSCHAVRPAGVKEQTMNQPGTLITAFDDRNEAQKAVEDLKAAGFGEDQIGFALRGADVIEGGM